MFLSGVSEIIIRRVGRWSSEAFLEYIREQVETFTIDVSQKMLEYENFHHLNADEIKSDEAKSIAKGSGGDHFLSQYIIPIKFCKKTL